MRLRLDGSLFPFIEVIEVSPTGMLLEAPVDPPLPVGHTAQIELDGRHGDATVTAVHGERSGRAYYSVRIVERDQGLIDAIRRASDWYWAKTMAVRHEGTGDRRSCAPRSPGAAQRTDDP